ncbi:MAG: FkbM family methyltransferase [Chloroflexota bacterium]
MPRLVGFYIGGEGGITGPIQRLSPLNVEYRLFDARTDLCFWSKSEQRLFYVCKNPQSSSLLPPDPVAAGHYLMANNQPWWSDVEVVETRLVDTIGLDEYCEIEGLWPDILGMNIQGAEWEVLCGGTRALGNILAVITEVEFHSIYLGQKLFADQDALLRDHGYQFAGQYDEQYWRLGDTPEKTLIVAIAVFLKHPRLIKDTERLEVLGRIAACFGLYSYVREALRDGLGTEGGYPQIEGSWRREDDE